jgi:integrase
MKAWLLTRSKKGWRTVKGRRQRVFYDTLIVRTGEILPSGRPKEKFIAIGKCTKAEAEDQRTKYLSQLQRGEFVEPSKMTLGQWLPTWLAETITPTKRPSTAASYKHIIESHLVPALGTLTLQALRPGRLQQYYGERRSTLSPATLALHHAIISGALKSAAKQGLVARNVAALVDGRPKVRKEDRRTDAIRHCWTKEEAQKAIAAAKTLGTQLGALIRFAIDSGARKGEIGALRWADVNLETGEVLINRTLLKGGRAPEFGPTKTGAARSITLDEGTVLLLREHKRQQAELKMRNRTSYKDLDLVFAKEWGDLHGRADSLGLPLAWNNIGGREFGRVMKAADVRRIKWHGLRHTCATLLLGAREPVHVVSQRLGHEKIQTTLDIYAHVLPSQQQQAARTMGGLLG